jgi:hypothetical protein
MVRMIVVIMVTVAAVIVIMIAVMSSVAMVIVVTLVTLVPIVAVSPVSVSAIIARLGFGSAPADTGFRLRAETGGGSVSNAGEDSFVLWQDSDSGCRGGGSRRWHRIKNRRKDGRGRPGAEGNGFVDGGYSRVILFSGIPMFYEYGCPGREFNQGNFRERQSGVGAIGFGACVDDACGHARGNDCCKLLHNEVLQV